MADTEHASRFTRDGFMRGFMEGIGLLPGMIAFGAVFGVLAEGVGLPVVGATAMSAFVFSGTAQLLAVHSWGAPDLLLATVVAVVAMNARYVLFGAAIQPWMRGVSPWIAYPSLFLLVDPNWATAMRERDAGRHDVAVFIGMGAACMVGWLAGTIAGAGFGGLLGDPRRLGLDDVEDLLTERLDQLLGIDRTDAADHAGAQVLLDAIDRCRRRRAQEARLELLPVDAVVDPFARGGHPFPGGDDRGVPSSPPR